MRGWHGRDWGGGCGENWGAAFGALPGSGFYCWHALWNHHVWVCPWLYAHAHVCVSCVPWVSMYLHRNGLAPNSGWYFCGESE